MGKKSGKKKIFLIVFSVLIGLLSRNNKDIFFIFFPFFFLWAEEHHTITREAIRVQPKNVQDWLEPEKNLLWKIYCMFPDLNWPWYGEWGGESGCPDKERLPDLRREWNISYYCGWDPLCQKEILYPPGKDILPPGCPPPSTKPSFPPSMRNYCPMGSYSAPQRYLPLLISAIEEGRFADGIRFLGVLLHHIQDRGAFTYWPELHMKGHITDQKLIHLRKYQPQVLGSTIESAISQIVNRMHLLSNFQNKRIGDVIKAHKSRNRDEIDAAILEFALETCRLTADTILTVAHLMDYGKPANYWGYWIEFPNSGNPTNINLVDNPSFERDDGSGYPDGWVIGWYNLKDRMGRAEWDWSRKHSVFSKVVRSGERSIKLMWTPEEGIEWRQRWPVAISVLPGEKYRCSGWIKCQKSTGKSYIAIYTYTRDNEPVKVLCSSATSGTHDWKRIEFDFKIPPKVEKIRCACRSDGNKGAVWFDDIEIIRL